MILINGESKNHIDISDRGFQYGDGLFETIEVRDGQAVFLARHLQRLESGCHRLKIPYPGAVLVPEIVAFCRQWQTDSRAVLKIMITRGSGGRGYRPPDPVQPTRVLSLHPYPIYPENFQKLGINARICSTRLGLNPSLAGIKHLNRLEQVMARAEWNDAAIQEGIMLDADDHVIEGIMTNLFLVKNHTLYTATLTYSGVAGIMRGIIITLAASQDITVIEHPFNKGELLSSDEVFVCNSIIGIWPVRQIGAVHFPVGPLTQSLQTRLNGFIETDLKEAGCID